MQQQDLILRVLVTLNAARLGLQHLTLQDNLAKLKNKRLKYKRFYIKIRKHMTN